MNEIVTVLTLEINTSLSVSQISYLRSRIRQSFYETLNYLPELSNNTWELKIKSNEAHEFKPTLEMFNAEEEEIDS